MAAPTAASGSHLQVRGRGGEGGEGKASLGLLSLPKQLAISISRRFLGFLVPEGLVLRPPVSPALGWVLRSQGCSHQATEGLLAPPPAPWLLHLLGPVLPVAHETIRLWAQAQGEDSPRQRQC